MTIAPSKVTAVHNLLFRLLCRRKRERIRTYAVEAFLAVECSGLGRVDFFYQEEEDRIYVSEINTIPGSQVSACIRSCGKQSGILYQAY